MRVLLEYPPNYAAIVRVFPEAQHGGVIFAYGDIIYNPSDITITRELVMHESIHSGRQGTAVQEWWARYLRDPGFRLAEELPAHRAEYDTYCSRHANSRKRLNYLAHVAEKLSSPLYGNLLTAAQAREAILTAR